MAELTAGMSRTATQFRQLFPLLLAWLSTAPSPDLGLLQLRTVADGPVRASAVVGALRDSPVAGERLCLLLGSSKVVGRALRRHPEALVELTHDDALAEPGTRDELRAEADAMLDLRRGDVTARHKALRRFVRRQELRIAERDLLGFVDSDAVGAEITALAEATLEAALAALDPGFPFTVIGLGKLGGGELGYASDLDVFFVHDGDSREAERVAETLVHDIGAQTGEGRAFDIDTRLRPEGRSGALALTPRRVPPLLGGPGPAVGAPGPAAGPPGGGRRGPGPALRRPAHRGGARHRPRRGRGAGDPPHQAAGGAGAGQAQRRPHLPPQVGSRGPGRRGVDGAAAPAAARFGRSRPALAVDRGRVGRARRSVGGWRPRTASA